MTNLYQLYNLLKGKNLYLTSTWRKGLRERSKALKQYLRRPEKSMELLQADITDVPVENSGTYYVIELIDHYSKYRLESHAGLQRRIPPRSSGPAI